MEVVQSNTVFNWLETPKARDAFNRLSEMGPQWKASVDRWKHLTSPHQGLVFCAPDIKLRAMGDKECRALEGGWAENADQAVIDQWAKLEQEALQSDIVVIVNPQSEKPEEFVYDPEYKSFVSLNFDMV